MTESHHDHFQNRPQTLIYVADAIAAFMAGVAAAEDFETVFGHGAADLTEVERERLDWAWGEVRERLYRIGRKNAT